MMVKMRNLVYLMFLIHYASSETYRTVVSVDGVKVNQDVEFHRKRNFMTVNVGKMSNTENGCNGVSTINLHDFETGMLAIKSIDKGECIVTYDTQNQDEALKSLEESNRYHIAHALTKGVSLEKIPMTEEQIVKYGGDRIAKFCKGYKTYGGKEIPKDKAISRKRARRGCWLSTCNNCHFTVY